MRKSKSARQKNDRLMDLLNEAQRMSMTGCWEWRKDDHSLLMSANQCALLGVPSPQSIDIETYLQPFLAQNLQSGSSSFCFEHQYNHPDGHEMTLLESGRAEFKNNQVVRIWGTTQAMAVESHKLAALGEMAGNIAHEINNPLAIIYAKTWNLMQMAETGRINKHFLFLELERIHGTVGRISKIIRNLQRLTRPSNHELMEPIRVSQIIEDTAELCRSRIKDLGVQLVVQCTHDEWVHCRAPQISQILIRLLNNSLEAIGSLKDSWVKVKTERNATGICIMVLDSRSGPLAADQANGIDLGMFNSRRLAEHNGGRLYLDTRFMNTCFTLELPIIEIHQAA